MNDFTNPLPDAGVKFWTIIAAVAGALLSLRTVVEASPWVRMSAVGSSFVLAFFGGPFGGRILGWGDDGERVITLIIAFLGVNLLSGVALFGAKWREDPHAAVAWLVSLVTVWRGGPK